jgi:IS30 family transposase
MQTYRRVTLQDRFYIQASIEAGSRQSEIASRIGFHKSTISREIKRLGLGSKYKASEANSISEDKFRRCRRRLKLSGALLKFTLKRLKSGWTPEQITARLRHEESDHNVSAQTIYRQVRRLGLLKTHLRFGYKRRGFGRLKKQKDCRKSGWKQSIHDRPSDANRRRNLGHWERDLFFTKNKKTVLVVTDRKSRYTMLMRNPNFKSENVAKLTNKLLSRSPVESHTMTNDNGSEFFDVGAVKIPVYFCDVQSSIVDGGFSAGDPCLDVLFTSPI